MCIVINDKSQSTTAKHLTFDGLLHYKFTIQSAFDRIFKLVNIWRSYRQNGWLFHIPHSPYTFVLKDAELAR